MARVEHLELRQPLAVRLDDPRELAQGVGARDRRQRRPAPLCDHGACDRRVDLVLARARNLLERRRRSWG